MRSTPEWRGKTSNSMPPNHVRVRIFDRWHGCCQCGKCAAVKILVGMKWEVDHRIALCNGGPNIESNLVPILVDHHKAKTAADVAVKSKTYRMRAKHLGLKKPSRFACSRDSGFRKKVNGTVVPRNETST